MKPLYIILLSFSFLFGNNFKTLAKIETGAEQLDKLIPMIRNKKIGIVVNQTSFVKSCSLLDTLLQYKIQIKKLFTPEHGYKGTGDAGEKITNQKEQQTQIPIISLYGKTKRPTPQQLEDIDLLIFDLQDVGTRFYTYISTMHYVMEACAENNIPLIILDRPNPNDTIDGPVLDPQYRSFVGMHPIPLLHGLTIGELAQMINGEGWLRKDTCPLIIIPIQGWKHGENYTLPIAPSPNLPNQQSILLYPSLCLFEPTQISVGRGTQFPFQIIGGLSPTFGNYTFTPYSIIGASKYPKHKGKKCYGKDLRSLKLKKGFHLDFLIEMYHKEKNKNAFFTNKKFFQLLSGSNLLYLQLKANISSKEIRKSWQPALQKYRQIRQKYLLYPDYND